MAILRRGINLHNPIHSVIFSPNGDLIATAGVKQGVQVWNAITGGNTASLGDGSSTSLLVCFSPSGAFLAAALEGGTIVVWDPKVGREHLKHKGCHTEPIMCIEFSKNSALLASGSRDCAIQVWSVETAQPLFRLATHEGPVTSLAFSSDSLRLFSGSEDNSIIIWDMSSGKLVRGMTGHRKPVNCVAVSKDGSIVTSGSEDKTIKIWDTSSGKCTKTFSKGHHSGIRSVRFFDEDKRVVAACDGAIISWDVASRSTSETIWAVEQFVKTMMQRVPAWRVKVVGWGAPKSVLRYVSHHVFDETSPEHVTIAYADRSSSFVFAHRGYLHSGTLPTPTSDPPLRGNATVTGVSISSDGLWAATANLLGSLEIIDLTIRGNTWEEVEISAKSDPLAHISNIVPSPNGRRFILKSLFQWCLADADYHIVKKIDMGVTGSMCDDDDIRFRFSADGSIFFSVVVNLFRDDKSTMRVFDSVTGEQRAQFTGLKKVHSIHRIH
ncbi:WD40-repeat-containing domain protein [Lanmaoa asiatica]|nr:WD40-repeat-containing domain protein [Lanmaoa asiatica]